MKQKLIELQEKTNPNFSWKTPRLSLSDSHTQKTEHGHGHRRHRQHYGLTRPNGRVWGPPKAAAHTFFSGTRGRDT